MNRQLSYEQHGFLSFLISNQWTWLMGSDYSIIRIQEIMQHGYYDTKQRWVLNSLRMDWTDYKNKLYDNTI
jgi:hypothetical protein